MPQYSVEQKYQAVGAFRLGNAIKEIAEVLNLPTRSIYRWCGRFEAEGNCDRAPGSGRPRRTSRRADRCLLRIVERARFSTSQQLLAAWRKAVSTSTVKRRLHELGFVARRPAVSPLLTPRHRTIRLSWAMARCHFRSQWHRIIFSDESRIKLRPMDGRVRVWRRTSERFNENCQVHSVEYGGGSIHVWGGICKGGRTELVVMKKTVNGAAYIEVLQNHLIPFAQEKFGDLGQCHFQDDNAPAHRAVLVRTFKESAGIRSISWPARSPDLNPIEHLWDTLKRRIRQRSPQPGSLQQLSAAAIEEWNAIPQAAIDHLIDSMTSRVGAVIQAEGGATKY